MASDPSPPGTFYANVHRCIIRHDAHGIRVTLCFTKRVNEHKTSSHHLAVAWGAQGPTPSFGALSGLVSAWPALSGLCIGSFVAGDSGVRPQVVVFSHLGLGTSAHLGDDEGRLLTLGASFPHRAHFNQQVAKPLRVEMVLCLRSFSPTFPRVDSGAVLYSKTTPSETTILCFFFNTACSRLVLQNFNKTSASSDSCLKLLMRHMFSYEYLAEFDRCRMASAATGRCAFRLKQSPSKPPAHAQCRFHAAPGTTAGQPPLPVDKYTSSCK